MFFHEPDGMLCMQRKVGSAAYSQFTPNDNQYNIFEHTYLVISDSILNPLSNGIQFECK